MQAKKGRLIAETQIDQPQKEMLAALSITTVEELYGLLQAVIVRKFVVIETGCLFLCWVFREQSARGQTSWPQRFRW